MNQALHLSAKFFIQALKGETIVDTKGRSYDFLQKGDEFSQNVIYIKNVTISEPVNIGQGSETLVINFPVYLDCKFQSTITINNVIFKKGLFVKGGKFIGKLIISGGKFHEMLVIDGGKFESSIIIKSGHFYKGLSILDGIYEKSFHLEDGVFEDDVNVSGGVFEQAFKITGGNFQSWFRVFSKACFKRLFEISGGSFFYGFNISGGRFEKKTKAKEPIPSPCFIIKDGKFYGEFSVSGGDFESGFYIQNGNFSDLRIKNGSFKIFFIKGGEFRGVIEVQRGKFHDFSLTGGNYNSVFKIKGGEFEDQVQINGGNYLDQFVVESGNFKRGILVQDGNFCKNFIVENNNTNSLISSLTFALNSFINSKFIVKKGSRIDELYFREGIASGGMVYIYDIKLKKVSFDRFVNEGILEVTGLTGKPDAELIFFKSNLDNTVFKGVVFSSFKNIIIDDTKLNNISTINRHFPTEKGLLNTSVDIKHKKSFYFKKMAENFNQLYLAMQKQGNRLQEMDYYVQYLTWQHKAAFYDLNIPALVSLTLHKCSTNFGKNWIRGVILSLIIGAIFYLCFVWFLPDIKSCNFVYSSSNISFHFKNYLYFLLPTHKPNFINNLQPGGTSAFFDFSARIILAYLYYQTITAFRRFGRK